MAKIQPITQIKNQKLNFKQKENRSNENISTSHNQNDYKKLIDINSRVNSIIEEIGGIDKANGLDFSIEAAKAKIYKLKLETDKAWSNCPEILKQKINKLDSLSQELDILHSDYEETTYNINTYKPGVILPEKQKILTNPIELRGLYNKSMLNNITPNFADTAKKITSETPPLDKLRNTLNITDRNNWNYEKFNHLDAYAYNEIKDSLLFEEDKKKIHEQISAIEKKLAKIKKEEVYKNSSTGLNIYYPNQTGRLLALETAKMRRTALLRSIIINEEDKYLAQPNILFQPTSTGESMPFLLDKRYVASNYDINSIVDKNEDYGPVLKKLFPEGLNLFIVPGYSALKGGNLNGGESIPTDPDAGVWLNSYDYEQKHDYSVLVENVIAKSRDLTNFNPSTLIGKDDRSRALAHEIGHAIYYKIQQKDNQSHYETPQSIVNKDINFITGWQFLRIEAKKHLNNNELNKRETRYLSDSDKMNLTTLVEYEMIAEDIRLALNSKTKEASSKMSGIYDQSEAGKYDFDKVTKYIRAVLLENRKPSEAFFDE